MPLSLDVRSKWGLPYQIISALSSDISFNENIPLFQSVDLKKDTKNRICLKFKNAKKEWEINAYEQLYAL